MKGRGREEGRKEGGRERGRGEREREGEREKERERGLSHTWGVPTGTPRSYVSFLRVPQSHRQTESPAPLLDALSPGCGLRLVAEAWTTEGESQTYTCT